MLSEIEQTCPVNWGGCHCALSGEQTWAGYLTIHLTANLHLSPKNEQVSVEDIDRVANIDNLLGRIQVLRYMLTHRRP